ncbi:hypothetical protein TNCT6_69180 [Streptomyces sp. 6-11-2]|nr:hypothetical protein TNCT6_69180 [Streptomyces sp. 6-11-2]
MSFEPRGSSWTRWPQQGQEWRSATVVVWAVFQDWRPCSQAGRVSVRLRQGTGMPSAPTWEATMPPTIVHVVSTSPPAEAVAHRAVA